METGTETPHYFGAHSKEKKKHPHGRRSINLSKVMLKTYVGIDCTDVAGGAEGHESRVSRVKGISKWMMWGGGGKAGFKKKMA